jgi:hypothetical protein
MHYQHAGPAEGWRTHHTNGRHVNIVNDEADEDSERVLPVVGRLLTPCLSPNAQEGTTHDSADSI